MNIKVGDRIEDEETEGEQYTWVVDEVFEDYVIGAVKRSFERKNLVLAPNAHSRSGRQYFSEITKL